MRRTLRVLVLVEIALGLSSIAADLVMDRFLPEPLRAYLADVQAAELTRTDLLVIAAGMLLLPLLITAWVAIWRLSPRARLLYSLSYGLSLPLTVAMGPSVRSGVGVALESATLIVGGLILGILYFADPTRPVPTFPTAGAVEEG